MANYFTVKHVKVAGTWHPPETVVDIPIEQGQALARQGKVVAAQTLNVDDLNDVNAPSPADLETLTWDNTAGEWISA